MNTLVRFVSAAAVLGTAFLLTACVTQTSRAPRAKVVEEFSVVESSTDKELTPAQIADLRQAVANYLREQGLTDGRTYYVKVNFPTENPEDEPQWAVVRIGAQSARTYTVVAAYPGRDDYYPYDFYPAGYSFANYYPGYAGFSRWGYYDPFDYNYGAYHRPTPRDYDHTKTDKPTKPDDPNDKPRHQPGPRNRWDNPPGKDDDQPRGNSPRRTPDPERWNRDRTEPRDGQPRLTPRPERSSPTERNSFSPERHSSPPPERTYTPPPERTYSPPPERSSPPPARETSSRPEPERRGLSSTQEQER